MSVSGDGSTAFVNTTPNTFLGPASAYTMHCWYQNPLAPGTAANRGVMTMNDTPTNTYIAVIVWHHTTNPKSVFHREAGGTFRTATISSSLLANTWYAIGARYDGANIQMFLNGTANGASTAAANQTGSTTCQLGCLAEGKGTLNFDQGTIAEAGWWNTNLTDAEMLALGLGLSPLLVRPTSLLQCVSMIDTNLQNRLGFGLSSSGLVQAAHPPGIIYPWEADAWDRMLVFVQNLQQTLTLNENETDSSNVIHQATVSELLHLTQNAIMGFEYETPTQNLSLKQQVKVIVDSIASGRFREVDGQQDG